MDFASSTPSGNAATPEEQQQALVQGINTVVVQMLQGVRHNVLTHSVQFLSFSKPARLALTNVSLKADASLISLGRMSRYAWLNAWIACNIRVDNVAMCSYHTMLFIPGLSPTPSLPRLPRRWHRICRVLWIRISNPTPLVSCRWFSYAILIISWKIICGKPEAVLCGIELW